MDRAKQVTVGELNSLLGVSRPSPSLVMPWPQPRHPVGANLPTLSITLCAPCPCRPPPPGHPLPIQQQNQLQPLSHAPPVPLTPRPAGLVGAGATGLLALSGALAAQAQLVAAVKEDRVGVDTEGSRGEWATQCWQEGDS